MHNPLNYTKVYFQQIVQHKNEKLKVSFIYNKKIAEILSFFSLSYSWFIILYQFLVYGKVIQIYFFPIFSIMIYYRILNRFPCVRQQDLVVYLFNILQFPSANLKFLTPNLSFSHHLSPLVSINLYSMSVNLYQFHK